MGFAGSALDQLSSGDGFSLRRALGSAANGMVTGAVKGALIGSGAGIPVAFGADFAAGAAGNLLEQAISGERVNAGRGILGGLSNAVSGAIFGNVPFKNAGEAFGKGALAGAATSGLGYLSDLIGRQPKSGQMRHFPGGAVARTPYERLMDPRGICILQDVFGGGLGIRKAYGYRYEMRDPDQPVRDGFDLGDFLRSTLTGGLMGGLSGVAFFGVDKAVKALEGSLSGGGKGGSDVIKNNLASKVKNIREQMPSTNLAKCGNMAVADVDVPGIKDNFLAHSKINDVLDKGFDIADFSYLKSENERIFTSYVNDQYPRYHDTEAKILEDIAYQITDPNVSGTINLYSELPCCQSCSNIILEFRRMFPNIELNIFVE